jgi:hypothetical protein
MKNCDKQRRFKLVSVAGATLFAAALLFSNFGAFTPSRADSSIAYNNVQVFLTPQAASGTLTYTLSVYNSSGSLVSNSQSEYPAFSLELPSANYLFAATIANSSNSLYYYNYYTTNEYGYQLVQVSSSTTLSIATKPIQDISTQQIKVHTQFVNGSAISGASVSGSVVGLYYWWPFASPYISINMWNQTDSNGDAVITVPSLPIIVNAWDWVQVNLPTNETTVQRVIGGQTVNVTVYWQPTYVGLSGSVLVVPPSNSASITLYAIEQPSYWWSPGPLAYGSTGVSGSYTTIAGQPMGEPASVYNQQQQTQMQSGKGIAPMGTPSSSPRGGAVPPNQIPPIVIGSTSSNNSGQSIQFEYATLAASLAAVFSAAMIGFFVLRQRRTTTHAVAPPAS